MNLLSWDECRTLLFKFSVEWSALSDDHVISVHVTETPEDCQLQCYLEDDYMSINIEVIGDGTCYCELSDSDHVLHPRDLENQKDIIYISVQVRISDSTDGSIFLSILFRKGMHKSRKMNEQSSLSN